MTPNVVQHVSVSGFSWTTVFTLLLNLLVGGALVGWIKTRPKMRELEQTAEERFIDTLSKRVSNLEDDLKNERIRHDAEASLLRHRANNSDQCLDALLLLLESMDDLPDRVKRALGSVKEMRVRQKQEEALEKGAMKGAQLTQIVNTTI